jgi:hypothetical protein
VGAGGLGEFWAEVDNREWLAARALLEVSARVRGVAEMFVYRDGVLFAAGRVVRRWCVPAAGT